MTSTNNFTGNYISPLACSSQSARPRNYLNSSQPKIAWNISRYLSLIILGIIIYNSSLGTKLYLETKFSQ